MSIEPFLYLFDATPARQWLILDRDGTINVDHGYTHAVQTLEFMPGALEALTRLAAEGWGIAIATNQAGLAKGLFTREDMESFNWALIQRLASQGVAIRGLAACPHHPEGTVDELAVPCLCRKPASGLLHALSAQHNFTLERAIYVGNASEDAAAAGAANMKFYWCRNGIEWNDLLTGETKKT
jgi:D-glycero-D-manno-heptose 1,7-bisphosphate phosphatase